VSGTAKGKLFVMPDTIGGRMCMRNSILVVEDEEKILRLLELELEYEGYEVGKALDGLEAFTLYQSRK
jgi:two-component system OmpR family response regulator